MGQSLFAIDRIMFDDAIRIYIERAKVWKWYDAFNNDDDRKLFALSRSTVSCEHSGKIVKTVSSQISIFTLQ
jgi:hypothetical protein